MTLFDLRHALRRLVRNPFYSLTVILLLGLALGAGAGGFSVIYGMLYKPLPFPQQERLVSMGAHFANMDAGLSVPLLEAFSARSTMIEQISGYQQETMTLNEASGRRDAGLQVVRTQPSLLALLNVQPALGRLLTVEDSHEGAARSMVLSYATWQQRFNGASDVLDRTLRLDGSDYRVVGVLPQGFGFPDRAVQAMLPLSFTAAQRDPARVGNFNGLKAAGRLHDGVTLAAATSEMSTLARALPGMEKAFDRASQFSIDATPLRDLWLGKSDDALQLMLLAVGLVLLVTTANLCNLAIARALARRQELAVQEALGAGRWQQARQTLIETALLCLGGAAVALAVLPGVIGLLRHFGLVPSTMPQAIGIDPPTLAVVGLLTLLVTAAMTMSGLWLRRGDLNTAIRQGGLRNTASRTAQRARQGLIVGQIALTVALLIGIGLLLRSSQRLLAEDVGFNREHLVLAGTEDLGPRGGSVEQRQARLQQLIARARELPGVTSAGIGNQVPFGGNMSLSNFSPPGAEGAVSEPTAYKSHVDAGYFQALGTPLLRGRGFSDEEVRTEARVAIVDERFVSRYVGDRDPIGLRFRIGDGEGKPMRDLTIIGVATTVKQRALDESAEYVTVYQPQNAPLGGILLLRTAAAPQSLIEPLQALFTELAPDGSAGQLLAMEDHIAGTLADRARLNALLQLLGIVALALATVGLYAVLAYTVRIRSAEFGIRMALGAAAGRVARDVLGQGLALIGAGLLLGLPMAYLAARLLATRLYGVDAFDPLTLAGVAVMLLAVGVAACWLPARRAAQTDPMIALRSE